MRYSRFRATRTRYSQRYSSSIDARDLANVREAEQAKRTLRERWHVICNALLGMQCEPVEPYGDDGQNDLRLPEERQRDSSLTGAQILLIIACLPLGWLLLCLIMRLAGCPWPGGLF